MHIPTTARNIKLVSSICYLSSGDVIHPQLRIFGLETRLGIKRQIDNDNSIRWIQILVHVPDLPLQCKGRESGTGFLKQAAEMHPLLLKH